MTNSAIFGKKGFIAKIDINTLESLWIANLSKNYKPTNDFRCHYINDDVNQYLDWASNNLNVLNTNSFESLSEHPISKG